MNPKIDRFAFANDLRGPAALAVLVGHFLHNAWYMRPLIETFASVNMPNENSVPTPMLAQWISAIPSFEWGAFGVAVFFLISGFVIPLSLTKYSTLGFLIGRVFRIWPTYLAGFSVTLLTMLLASRYFGRDFTHTTKDILIHYVPGLRDILWSKNIDGVIWTLEIEIKFYLVCAMAASLIRRWSAWLFTVPAIIGIACLLATGYLDRHGVSLRPSQIVAALTLSGQFIIYMFVGTTVAFVMNRSLSIKAACTVGAGLIGLFIALSLIGPWRTLKLPLGAYGAALVLFIVTARLWHPRSPNRALRLLSNISYPLYASHIAVGYVIIATALKVGASPATGICLAFMVPIVLAWCLHRFVETPTHRLGQRIARRVKFNVTPRTETT